VFFREIGVGEFRVLNKDAFSSSVKKKEREKQECER
jgi:hypothetical protein